MISAENRELSTFILEEIRYSPSFSAIKTSQNFEKYDLIKLKMEKFFALRAKHQVLPGFLPKKPGIDHFLSAEYQFTRFHQVVFPPPL